MSNIKFVLQKLQDGSKTLNDALDVMLSSLRESRITMQRERMKLVSIVGLRSESSDELIDDEMKKKKVPMLRQCGIPITADVIQLIARDLAQLDNMFPEYDLLKYTNWSGHTSRLLRIPTCKTNESFQRMNNDLKFVDNLPQYISASSDHIKVSNVAGWIIRRLSHLYEEQIALTAKKLGFISSSQKMDSYTAEAMWCEADVNLRQQRTILRYLRGFFGRKFFIPSTDNTKVNCADELFINYKDPNRDVKETVVDKEKVYYWSKPIKDTINFSIMNRSNDSDLNNIHTVDLILGGDHGQGSFKSILKIILRGQELHNIIDQWVICIGAVECKKDTYAVLKNTILPVINVYLQDIRQNGEVLLFSKHVINGELKYAIQVGNKIIKCFFVQLVIQTMTILFLFVHVR